MIGDDPDNSAEPNDKITIDNWKIWKTGISLIFKGRTLFILKQELNLNMNWEEYTIEFFKEMFRIELYLDINECVTLVQDMDSQLSHSYISGLATRLLVMMSQHVESLVKSWFPGMLKTQLNGSLMTLVPCWKCYAGIGFDDLSVDQLQMPECFVCTIKNPVFCFILEENIVAGSLGRGLQCPIHDELQLLHMMPDLVRTTWCMTICAMSMAYTACPLQIFTDVNMVFGDDHSASTLLDDSNRLIGKGGFGFLFEGELRSRVGL